MSCCLSMAIRRSANIVLLFFYSGARCCLIAGYYCLLLGLDRSPSWAYRSDP